MSIFTDTEELKRQGRHVAFDRVEGPNKQLMSVLGYQDTGELNTFGKIIGGGIGSNLLASTLARGTDAQEVLKSTRGDAVNSTLQKASFGLNLASSGGASALGSIGQSLIGGLNKKNDLDSAIKDLDSSVEKSSILNEGDPVSDYWKGLGYSIDPETKEYVDKDGNSPSQDLIDGVPEQKNGSSLLSAISGDVAQSGLGLVASMKNLDSSATEKFNEMNREEDVDKLNYL